MEDLVLGSRGRGKGLQEFEVHPAELSQEKVVMGS